MTTTVLTGSLADLAAYPFVRLGYHPWGSLCLIGMLPSRGGRRRLGPVARLDLDALDARAAGEVSALAEQMRAVGYTSFAAVLVTDVDAAPSFAAAARDPRVARALASLRAQQCNPAHVLLVAGGRWGHVRCPGPVCCGREGRSLEEVRSGRLWAEHVLAGRAVLENRSDLGVAPCADPHCAAVAEADQAVPPQRADEPGDGTTEVVDRAVTACRFWAVVIDAMGTEHPAHPGNSGHAGHPSHAVARSLAATLGDVRVRDAVLAWALGSSSTGGPVDCLEPDAARRALDAALPPGARVDALLLALESAAAHGRGPARVHALAALGYVLWWSGQGARADVVVRQALSQDPTHTLAALVGQVLAGRVPPPWVGRRDR